MGSYLNPGSFSFRGSLRSKIYVDKSELIAKINEVFYTEQKYYFRILMISKDSSYRENLNQYDVIKINMQEFLSLSGTIEEMLEMLRDYLFLDSNFMI